MSGGLERSGHLVTIASIAARQVDPGAGIYSATKYAVRVLTEAFRMESDPSIRATTIYPGMIESELAEHITDPSASAVMASYLPYAIPSDAIARAVAFAIEQPADVDVNEIVVRPAVQRP